MILSHSRPAAYYYFPPLRLTTQIRSCTTTIPEVHAATLSLREVDYSGILQSARMVKVTRKTRVSFEKPADDIVMDELFVNWLGEGRVYAQQDGQPIESSESE